MRTTIEGLNEKDNPVEAGGELLGNDGVNQLWDFPDSTGPRFANRTIDEEGDAWWSSDEEDLEGWFLDNDRSEWIDNRL